MKSSQSITSEINRVPVELRLHHVRARAAEIAVDQLENLVHAELCLHRGGESLDNPQNSVAAVVALAQSETGSKLSAAKCILETLVKHPDYTKAQDLLDPLHKELQAAIEAEQESAREQHLAEQAVKEAEQAAREKLEAKIAKDPRVQKAKDALQNVRRLGQPLLAAN